MFTEWKMQSEENIQETGTHTWWDNIKMDLKEIACEGVDWIHPAQDMSQWHALVNMVMNLSVPLKVENFLTNWMIIGFWRWIVLQEVT